MGESHLALAKRYEDSIVFDTEGRHIRSSNKQSMYNLYLFHRQVWSKALAAERKRCENSQRKTSREINTHTIHLLMLPYKTAWLFPGHDDKIARFIRHSRAERKQLWCFVKARQLWLLLVDLAVCTPHCDCMHRKLVFSGWKSFKVPL